jgi:GTP-binding protein EngB required for normal cell division
LPGYGYARISKERKAEWRPLIEGFLTDSPRLWGVVQLLDVRHDPSPDDMVMLDFLAQLGVPTIFAVTKVDKLRKVDVAPRIQALAAQLRLDPDQIVPFSATTTGELLPRKVSCEPSCRSASASCAGGLRGPRGLCHGHTRTGAGSAAGWSGWREW